MTHINLQQAINNEMEMGPSVPRLRPMGVVELPALSPERLTDRNALDL
jgi:hypothetical protein